MDIFNHHKIPLLAQPDILVIGAGSAGCIAALAAATQKKYSVMLDTFYGFFTPGDAPKKIVGGLPDKIVNELDKTNDIFLRPNTYGAGTGVNYNPERLKYVWDQQILGNGIHYLLHTNLVGVVKEGNENSACIFWNKSGFYKVIARRIIDASGDADYCFLSGLDCEIAGKTGPAQSMTTTFRMCNVDLDAYGRAGGGKMLKEKMKSAVDNGTHPLPRKEGSAHEMCQPKCISTVAVKVAGMHPLDTNELTKAEIEGRRQAFIYEDFFRDAVPGYEDSRIIGLSHQIGVRETRRVYGEHRLTKEECMKGLIPPDSILLCGAPIEDHRKGENNADETYWEYIPGKGVYGVPYGTIVPKNSAHTWVVGRCFSATHDAHASCRSMAQTMSMGQAAGLAAIQSMEKDLDAKNIDVGQLRNRLIEMGQVLELPSAIADTSRGGWKNYQISKS